MTIALSFVLRYIPRYPTNLLVPTVVCQAQSRQSVPAVYESTLYEYTKRKRPCGRTGHDRASIVIAHDTVRSRIWTFTNPFGVALSSTARLWETYSLLSVPPSPHWVSVFDLFLSLSISFSPLPQPASTGLPGAHGNVASCTTQGFFLQLGIGSLAYSTMLILYYLLLIRWGVSEDVIKTRIEPLMHLAAIGYYLATAILGIVWQIYNSNGVVCWVAAVPTGCERIAPHSLLL